MHVVVEEGLFDAAFVDAHTVGFPELRDRVREYTPERVAGITGVPAERIRWLARLYATTKPSFLRIGNGLQHHSNGGMAVRTIACLPALVGAWGQLGGGAYKSTSGYFKLNGAAIEREQGKVRPLPAVIDSSTMRRVTASIGRCAPCGLAPAAWTGAKIQLCDGCYQRAVRREIEAGAEAVGAG
jgi:anaerobic selenocysteine-containing dehydrogenase